MTMNIPIQGDKGIRQWMINWCTMYMPMKMSPFVDYNKWLKCLDAQLNEPNNQKFQ